MLYACPPNRFLGRRAFCAFPFAEIMKDGKEEELKEAKELFKEGLKKIFQATKKVSEKVAEGFREGYAEDVTKKEKYGSHFEAE
jgi:hypothetical protein